MTKQQQNLISRCLETTELNKIEGFRYAEIVAIDPDTGFIWVDYPDNPLKRKLPALIKDNTLKIKNAPRSTLRPCMAKIVFDEGNPAMPMIKEVFYALNKADEETPDTDETLEKTIHVKADRIILEADTEVIIKSGKVKTVYQGKEGKIEEEADNIRSTARTNNRLRGGSVLIN